MSPSRPFCDNTIKPKRQDKEWLLSRNTINMNGWKVFLTLLLGATTHCGIVAGDTVDADGDIRGGADVDTPIPWYVAFADTTICGGVLVGPLVAR